MQTRVRREARRVAALAAILLLTGFSSTREAAAEVAAMYAIDLLGASGSEGVDVNDQGVAIGVRSVDMHCGPFCGPTLVEGVWKDEDFVELPWLPQWENIYLEAINSTGWVVGTAYNQSDIRAIVWKPAGDGYEIIEIGNFPDTDFSVVVGIDDQNRVVGYAYRSSPPVSKSFLWSETDGLVDLAELGFPSDEPKAISPGGTVAYLYGWYQLDLPDVVHLNTSPPAPYQAPGAYVEINDAGDQVRLVGRTDQSGTFYAFRYHNDGSWEQIWSDAAHNGSPFGVGSINSDLDIAFTMNATGVIAPGPAGFGEDVTGRLSPAYDDATVGEAQAINERGEMLAEVAIGRSQRLVRLVEAEECTTNCTRVSHMEMRAEFVDDPNDPGRCVGTAHTRADVRLRVADEAGTPLEGVVVTGHFMDDEWTHVEAQSVTDRRGIARVEYLITGGRSYLRGFAPPCTGTLAFLVTDARKDERTFDRVHGILQRSVIPQ